MSMTVGIIGKPRTGKSTVFRALCGNAQIENHAGLLLSRVSVPDWRIDQLADLYQPRKVTNVTLDFADCGSSSTPNQQTKSTSAGAMRDFDALAVVIGAFALDDREAVVQSVRETLEDLILGDLLQVENSLERVKKEKQIPGREQVLVKCRAWLEAEKVLKKLSLSEAELFQLSGFRLMTLKPIFAVINEAEADCNKVQYPGLEEYCTNQGIAIFRMVAPLEEDLVGLTAAEQGAFLADLGFTEPARRRFLAAAYSGLDLIAFFTVGKEEVRAWPIPKHTIAMKAAGKIHSDIERGFIRAELMRYEDLLELRTESKVKEAGKWRLVGKDYEIQDGDVVAYRFHV